MPVPSVIITMSSVPCAAPAWCSPRRARRASFSIRKGSPSASRHQPGRSSRGASSYFTLVESTRPAVESTIPQKPNPSPAQSVTGTPALAAARPSASAIRGRAAARPWAASSSTVSTATTSRSSTTAHGGVAASQVHGQRLHHDRSISSRLRPLVSGITRQMKRKFRTLIAA